MQQSITYSEPDERDSCCLPMDDEMLGGAATRKNGKRLMAPAQFQRLAGLPVGPQPELELS